MEERRLTKADIDKVRHIEGFPIAKDEDIIALSRPPYDTACPNPSAGKSAPHLPYTRDMSFSPLEVLMRVYHGAATIFPQGIHDAWLYGSYARGDFTEDSDVDILLTLTSEPPANYRYPLSGLISRLSLEYDKTISVTAKPLWRFLRYANTLPYYSNIMKEGIRYAGS